MNSWQEFGKHLEDTAQKVAKQDAKEDEPFLLSVHILLDEAGNPLDWLGPNLQRTSSDQWLVLRSALTGVEGEDAPILEDTAVKKQAVNALIQFLQDSA